MQWLIDEQYFSFGKRIVFFGLHVFESLGKDRIGEFVKREM
jgi:hypothetical protein